LQPFSFKASEMARPMPRVPPVTIAFLAISVLLPRAGKAGDYPKHTRTDFTV
jgi:hypothetical protein